MSQWRVRVDSGTAEPYPVLIESDPTHPRGAVIEALRQVGYDHDHAFVGDSRWSADDQEPVATSGLANGTLVAASLSRLSADEAAVVEAGCYLVVVGGPASGWSVRLRSGEPVIIGRSLLGDRLMSLNHARIDVDGSQVTITDLGSTNGTRVDDEPVAEAVVAPDAIVAVGATLFTVVELDEAAVVRGVTPTGINIHRQFREARQGLPASPTPPKEPRAVAESLATPWWRSLMPILTAVGMAWMFGRWQFLLIAALAPIVYAVDNARRKRRMRADAADDRQRYERDLAGFRAQVAEFRADETRRLRQTAVTGGRAVLLARFRDRRIWERRPADTDFMSATLGFAPLQSRYADVGADELWNVPLAVSLVEEGPLSVVGDADRAAAVLRSLLVELSVTHAPIDLNLWVFAEEARSGEWGFVRWLPHAADGDRGTHLAVSAPARSVLSKQIRRLIEQRRDAISNGAAATLPLQLVVVDGAESLPAHELAELLRDGPAVGVIGIVADRRMVPEGCRGELKIGAFVDECSYRSEATPHIEPVVVSLLAHEFAEQAALGLAPIEAFGTHHAHRLDSPVLFTELIGYGDRDIGEQLEAWTDASPTTSVPVGVDLDGQIIEIDLAKQGPHGLVGGTTRSGKTEFIKTFLASLAVHNSPDDIAMVIVDFKNAVDYPELARLPHVLAVATNSNADLFSRTLTLLTAELDRRGELFRDVAGVATIEGYHTARAARPDLPAVPRLVVVVDEFAKLMNSEEGSAQIKRLEDLSLAGAAFGIHLLLVTQDFTGKLPPQINEQAGLRICFKVLSAGPSKAVLGTPVAASVSASTPGRAYLRSKDGDAIEFQSARIANRAVSTAGDIATVRCHHLTLDALTLKPERPQPAEVPNHEQDLYRVVDVATRAAKRGGWHRAPVPWPDELSDEVALVELARGAIGIADDPQAQRVKSVVHDFGDDVVGLFGASGSGFHEALSTIAISLSIANSPDDLQIYGLDLVGQGLALLEPLPHVGTIATRDDATGMRILNRLITETIRRRSIIGRAGATDYNSLCELGGADLPRIMLLVLGIDRMVLHSEGGASPLLQPMTKLLNELKGTGIQVVFSGNAAMATNRFGAACGRRFVFPLADAAEYPTFIPKPFRSQIDRRGRAFDSASGLLSQLASPQLDPTGPALVPMRDLVIAVADEAERRHRPVTRPESFAPAPWPLQFDDVATQLLASLPEGINTPLPFGIRPESGAVLWLDPDEDGRAFRVVGAPKSGRSNALAALARMADAVGWDVHLAAASRRSSLYRMPALAPHVATPDTVVGLVAAGVSQPTLVLVDDAHRLDDDFPWRKLAEVHGEACVTVVAGSSDGLASGPASRRLGIGGGAVLMPTRARDVAVVGTSSIDDDWVINPLAGVGVAGIASEAHRVQFPLVSST